MPHKSMEAAVLRRTSRHGRLPFVIIAFALAIISAPGAALGGGPAAESMTGHNEAAAPKSERPQPRVEGRGVAKFDAGRGKKPKQPLQAFDSPSAPQADAAPSVGILAASAPAEVTSSGAPAATSFESRPGLDQAGTGGGEPPDPMVAVGPDDVVQAVNTDIRFTTREGAATTINLDASDFFEVADFDFEGVPITIDGISDVRWIYDAKHARWFGLVMAWHCDDDGAGSTDDAYGVLMGAISTGSSPIGTYYHFSILYKGFLPVAPMIGTSADKLVLTASEYRMQNLATGCAMTGLVKDTPTSFTFMWANLMTYPSHPVSEYSLWTPIPSTYEAPRPALSPQGTSNTIFGVITNNTSGNVSYFTINGTVSASSSTIVVTTVDLTAAEVVAPFLSPPAPIQPGGNVPAAVDRYPTESIWQDNVLTFASTYPCDPTGGGSENRDCARIGQLDTTTPIPNLVQDMLIGSTGKDTWSPAVAQSQNGTLHAVFNQSSSTEGMSSYTRYQLSSDSPNTMSTPIELADGGGVHYNGSRWGDFTGLAQDPRDTNAVWQGSQYTKADGTWATRVSELQTAGATFVPIDPRRILDSRVGTGLSGPFSANVARSLQIAGVSGIPADAVAITGNLTVTNQTAAGYLAVTQVPNNNPSTSTLNFPAGDNRANNVTSPLSTQGQLSVVYKAANGKSAHVILDVTGYFLNDSSGTTYTPVTPAPVRSLDSRDGTGLTGPFVDRVVRSWDVAGQLGVPPDAVAVTGNLTIVGQTSAGDVTVGPIVPSNPTTSSLNVPVGDVRANGLTTKLAADGSLSAVFRGTNSSATAHLVFDVTGYYLDDPSGARFVPITPGRRLDTRFAAPREGLTGVFTAKLARTLVVTPYQGVPNNATAITGNLTVVNQTKPGYLAMTPVAVNEPPTSTLNFPIGDVRANGVTGPLGESGSVGLVYVAAGGSTSHLLLDITGYFR
jgi:hypothetical protein